MSMNRILSFSKRNWKLISIGAIIVVALIVISMHYQKKHDEQYLLEKYDQIEINLYNSIRNMRFIKLAEMPIRVFIMNESIKDNYPFWEEDDEFHFWALYESNAYAGLDLSGFSMDDISITRVSDRDYEGMISIVLPNPDSINHTAPQQVFFHAFAVDGRFEESENREEVKRGLSNFAEEFIEDEIESRGLVDIARINAFNLFENFVFQIIRSDRYRIEIEFTGSSRGNYEPNLDSHN